MSDHKDEYQPPRWSWWVVGIVVPLLVTLISVVASQCSPSAPMDAGSVGRSSGEEPIGLGSPPAETPTPRSRRPAGPISETNPRSSEMKPGLSVSPLTACEGLEARLILDSRTQNGEILVNGEPALVTNRSGFIARICLPAADNYRVVVRGIERSCEALITIPLPNEDPINLCS